jgi:hypothetical protein
MPGYVRARPLTLDGRFIRAAYSLAVSFQGAAGEHERLISNAFGNCPVYAGYPLGGISMRRTCRLLLVMGLKWLRAVV